MAREDSHFRLRIPEDLKRQVEAEAVKNNRSMTAEIISRLERSFEAEPDWEARIEPLRIRLAKLEMRFEKRLKSEE